MGGGGGMSRGFGGGGSGRIQVEIYFADIYFVTLFCCNFYHVLLHIIEILLLFYNFLGAEHQPSAGGAAHLHGGENKGEHHRLS